MAWISEGNITSFIEESEIGLTKAMGPHGNVEPWETEGYPSAGH